jgi:hypothetical protein
MTTLTIYLSAQDAPTRKDAVQSLAEASTA